MFVKVASSSCVCLYKSPQAYWCIFGARVFVFSVLLTSGKDKAQASSRLLFVGFKAMLDQTDHCYRGGSMNIKVPVYFLHFFTCIFFNSSKFYMT